MLQLSFPFVPHFDIYFITSQLPYLFYRGSDVFYNVRITLYFGTFELRMEIMLQLRFVFVRHCDVTFITSRLQFLLRHIYVIYLFDAVTFFDDVRITL